jgi:lipid-binding SYLF domain-containing protein
LFSKAAKILASFVKPNQVFGQESVIPREILQNAKGLAIICVLKAGFLFSGRAGSGVIVARLPDGSWSAPSAIMTAGAGVGGQIGAELTDFVFILNNKAAVESFSQAGSITLGGNVSLAAGPIGRNAEAAGSASLKSVAAIFSYAKTKGLFAGISLEGSVLVERRDANRNFYGRDCTAKTILSGRVEPPPACDALFRVLESRAFQGNRMQGDYIDDNDGYYDDIPDEFTDVSDESYPSSGNRRRNNKDNNINTDNYDYEDNDIYGQSNRRGGYARGNTRPSASANTWEDDVYDRAPPQGSARVRGHRNDDYDDGVDGITRGVQRTQFRSNYADHPGRPLAPKPDYGDSKAGRRGDGYNGSGGRRRYGDDDDDLYSRGTYEDREPRQSRIVTSEKGQKAVALYTFEGEQSGDLSFRKGEVLMIVKKTETKDDWWTGRIGNKEGMFPANYVELM